MKRLFLFVLTFILLHNASAQEMLGPSFSNYAGQMGIGMNPAAIVGMPVRLEIHLLSMNVAAQNNYMYLRKNSQLVRNGMNGESIAADRLTDNYTTTDKWAYSSSFLKYPSVVWSGKRFAFALNMSTRAEVSATNIPYHLAKFMKEGFDYDPQQRISWAVKNGTMNALNWHELSLTSGMVFHDNVRNYWAGAVTLNYNYGLNGMYIDINDFKYNSIADTLLLVPNLNMEYGYALPADDDEPAAYLQKKGSGFSTNIGIRYFKNRNDDYFNNCRKGGNSKPYDFRVGLSLIDLGYVNFNQKASTFYLNDVRTDWYGIDTVKFSSISNMDSLLSLQFTNTASAFKTGNSMLIFTPAALTADVDIPLNNWLYVNTAIVQRIPLGQHRVHRMNVLAITPRIEFKRLEFALPFSLYEYSRPRLGASVRIGPLTFGTDALSPIAGVSNSYGADFYFGLSLRDFNKCENKKRLKRKPRGEVCNTPGD